MEPVVLKGNREGIVVHLNCTFDFNHLSEKLIVKIKAADAFLGSKRQVIINSGNTVLQEGQAQYLKGLLHSLNVEVKKFVPEVEEKEEVPRDMIVPQEKVLNDDEFLTQGPALIVRKNLRSGQNIYHEGTIIILGDVNPGAEVIATGHILVIGHLRGVAHAGAQGDNGALIFATKLEPTQLRIGNYITRAPDNEVLVPAEPEIARIKNDMVIIEKYLQK